MRGKFLTAVLSAFLALSICGCNYMPGGADDAAGKEAQKDPVVSKERVSADLESDEQQPEAPARRFVPTNTSGKPINELRREYFDKKISDNPYDAWLKSEMSEGLLSEVSMYGRWTNSWCNELYFTVESGKGLFSNETGYTKWKENIDRWLSSTLEDLDIELANMVYGYSHARAELIRRTGEIVRQKTIYAKQYLYEMQCEKAALEDVPLYEFPIDWAYISFESYDSIIASYRVIIGFCTRYTGDPDDDCLIFENEETCALYEKVYSSVSGLYPRDSKKTDEESYSRFGYTVKDINGDGTDELILRLDDHKVIAVFTTVNGRPVLLDQYNNSRTCWIDPDGYLHVSISGGTGSSVLQIYRISENTGELVLLEEGGMDERKVYYKLVEGTKKYISREEHRLWEQNLPYAKFEVTAKLSEYLPFVPLYDESNTVPKPHVPQIRG